MIREWREKLGWSQSETAEKLGVSIESFGNYEREKRPDRPFAGVPLLVDWAIAAIHAGLKPFSSGRK